MVQESGGSSDGGHPLQVPQAVASGLTVRVINNITKKLDVKQRFLETFKNDGFPTQFQYKQKVGLALYLAIGQSDP